jgi:hypothetical protein
MVGFVIQWLQNRGQMVDFHTKEVLALTNKSLHIKLMGREARQEFHLHTTGFESQDLLWSQGPRMGYTNELSPHPHFSCTNSSQLHIHNSMEVENLGRQVPTLFLLFAEWYTSIVYDEYGRY